MPVKKIDPVQGPAGQGKPGGLGARLENTLIRFVVDTFNRVRYALSDTLRHAADSVLETWEAPLLRLGQPLINRALAVPNLPPEIRAVLESARSGKDQVGAILLAFVALVAVGSVIPALFSGLGLLIQYVSNKTFRPNRLDFATWWTAVRRNASLQVQMTAELEDQGWTQAQMDAASSVLVRRLGVGEVLAAKYRGLTTREYALELMRQLGYGTQDANLLDQLSEQIPSASDLVRFAVREAWRDDVAARWGYDQGRPGPFDENMKKQGFPPWVSQAEWRAHWQLPSIGTGLEMLFRDEINAAEFRQLLIMQDVAPGWISHIEAISRPLPGRIDRRWAFEEGIIGEGELYTLYRADGMDERWARMMVQMVVSRSAAEAKGLTRAAIQSAYKKRRLSRDEALSMMAEIGVQESIASWYLQQADLDREQELLDQQIDNVKQRYLNNLIDNGQALEAQYALGVGGEEARVNLESWQLSKSVKVSIPSRANLDGFFKQGVIGIDQYRGQMALLGYDAQYVGWYLGALTLETAQTRVDEERTAQAERVRVDKERKASEYERGKAEIDQDIAEVNAAIADAQVALVELENARDQELLQSLSVREAAALEAVYRPLFADADAAVAQARLAQSEIRTQITELQSRVNDYKRALAAGRDVVLEESLTLEKAGHQLASSRLDTQIAGKRTDIAILQEAIPQMETVQLRGGAELDILTLEREIRELQESKAEIAVLITEIDGQLPAQLSAERRVQVQSEIDELQVDIDALDLEIDGLSAQVRETQVERLALEIELEEKLSALPSRAEQIEIRGLYSARIAEVEARVKELRANVADLRVEKTRLTVGWRESNV